MWEVGLIFILDEISLQYFAGLDTFYLFETCYTTPQYPETFHHTSLGSKIKFRRSVSIKPFRKCLRKIWLRQKFFNILSWKKYYYGVWIFFSGKDEAYLLSRKCISFKRRYRMTNRTKGDKYFRRKVFLRVSHHDPNIPPLNDYNILFHTWVNNFSI